MAPIHLILFCSFFFSFLAAHHPTLASCYSVLEYGGIATSPLAMSPSCPLPPSVARKSSPQQSVAHPSPPAVADSSPPAAAHSSGSGSPVSGQECRAMSPETWIFSLVMPTGRILIHPVLSVMSIETHLGKAAPHVVACCGSGNDCWGTLWGPLMSRRAQNGPQLPSLAQGGLSVPVGCPVPVFSPRGLLNPYKLPHGVCLFFWVGVVELRL